MKKIVSMILAAGCVFGCMATAGCQTEENIVTDENTINVRVYKAGFGDQFVYELKQKFDAAYADKGYKMNILTPTYGSAGTAMIQEMSRGYEETKIDLYITGSIMPNQVSPDGEYGEVAEDLSDIFVKTAIGYDGSESTTTIQERLNSDLVPFLCADNGKMYGLPWAQTSAGMVVNTKKLAAYGITELPRTTNELFEIFDAIYNGANGIAGSETSKTYPVTYNLSTGVGGASTYQNCAIATWFAQYDIDVYNQFLRMQEKGGSDWTDMVDAYKVFENENLKAVLEAGYHFMDEKYSAAGSSTQTLDQAQGLIMKDSAGNGNNAVFMLNGDWFLNEVKANYGTKLADIGFMNVPVISALGVKLFGAGTAYNMNETECDDVLSYICKLVDENKSVEEIMGSVKTEFNKDISKEDVQAVATARGICFSRGIEHLMFITKGSTKRAIAAEAIRMIASDDFANTFMNKANASSPYAVTNIRSEYAFVNQAANLVSNEHFRAINTRVQGLRLKVFRSDYIFPGESNLALTLYNRPANKTYAEAAAEIYNNSIIRAKTAWEEYSSK